MTDDDRAKMAAAREMQRRDAARGCLLAAVLEGAALLAGLAWMLATAFDWRGLRTAALAAFLGFTAAAACVAAVMLVLGNRPAARRLRRDAEAEPPE